MSENHYSLLLAGSHRDRPSAVRHAHNGTELVWVDCGQCTVEFDGNGVIAAGPGQLYITPARLAHSQRNTPDCVTFYAVMLVDAQECDDSLRLLDTGNDPMLRVWFHQLPELYESGSLETASRLLAAVWSRIGELERHNRIQETHPALARAVTYLTRHFAGPIDIADLATRSGISPSHLNLLFRRRFGMGPQRYLNELRLSRARQLLANPYWSVAEVAVKSGFPNPNYFSRKFHELHHQTPLECRKLLLAAQWVDFNPDPSIPGER